MPVILRGSEVERIRASIQDPVQTNKEARRAALRDRSQRRTEKWPNTLEAMRRKKDNWKKDREAKEEERRKAIDANELKLQKESRLRQIERANQLIYNQTDKMKTLRSKMLQCDVIQDRKIQIEEKQQLLQHERVREDRWNVMLNQQLAAADEREKEMEQQVMAKNAKMAQDQKQQLEEFKNRYIDQLREEKREGERIKAKALKDMEDEAEQERRRRLRAKQANEETKLANQKLQALRAKEKEKEKLEELKREADAKKKEEILAKRSELQRLKDQKVQARKQRMIDLAIQHLSQLEERTEERLENQKKEVREREDDELRRRAERRALKQNSIHASRQHQLRRARDIRAKELEEAAILAKEWVHRNMDVEMVQKREEAERKAEANELSNYIKSQTKARKTLEMEENAANLLVEDASKLVIADEDKRYREIAKTALEKSKDYKIENTYPLKTAVAAKSIDLLPAGGFRV